MTAQQGHCLESQHAVRATAVGDNLAVLRNVPETPRQVAQGYVDGLGQVSRRVLVLRPHVEHRDEAVLEALHELLPRNRLQRIASLEITRDDVTDLGEVALGDPTERCGQIEYRRIAQPIEDTLAVSARRQQAGPAHDPEVLRGVGNRQPDTLGKRFDAALALGEQLQDLQPMAVAERLGDLGKAGKQCALGTSRFDMPNLQVNAQ